MIKLLRLWLHIKNSIWFIPSVCTIMAIVLAIVTIGIDRRFQLDRAMFGQWFFFGVGAEGARGVLGVIAGSIITVTGVVFSITVVALQLASSQFTPRVLRSFIADRTNQIVFGGFIGTFTYALLVQRTVRVEDDDLQRFVPSISVNIAVLLALVSMGLLIRFIDHITRSIRASHIISRVSHDTCEAIDSLFPEQFGRPASTDLAQLEATLAQRDEPLRVCAEQAGYLQTIDARSIFRVDTNAPLIIRLEQVIGTFVLPGDLLLSVWADAPVDEAKLCSDLRSACVLGMNRTNDQDVAWGLVELSDIAIKALSPGINDPTTAAMVIDRLGESLVILGNRPLPARLRTDADGRIQVIAQCITFAQAVELAFAQIRHYGAEHPQIIARLRDMMERVATLVPEQQRLPLRDQMAQLERQVAQL
jgi:uncharacterized membrane protein